MQPPGSYGVPQSPQQWQQGPPPPPSGGPMPTPDPMGGFQPSSTPGQRILAAAGLLSGQPNQPGQPGPGMGPGVPPSQGQDPQSQAAMIAGQLDDATLLRLLQQRASQGGFPGVPGADQHPQQQQQQQQQQHHHHHPHQQQQQQPMQQQMQNPPQYGGGGGGGSPPQSGAYGGGQPGQFGEMRQGPMSSPPPAPSMGGGGGPGSQTTGNSGGGGGKSKTRARRGQATDPHSIAERLRRERIAERMRSLQELVPNSNKVDKASMLDDIIDYVKFLQLQVKVLNLNRLTGPAADAVASLLADLDPEDEKEDKGSLTPQELELTERQVALLMEQDMGMAMQYLQSKGLCLMPMSLAGMMNKGQGPHNNASHPGQPRLEGGGGRDRGGSGFGGGEGEEMGHGAEGRGGHGSDEAPMVKQEMMMLGVGGEGEAHMSDPGGM